VLFEINPFFAFIQRFVPRLLTGLLTGCIFRVVKQVSNQTLASFVAGFSAAFLNTTLFMLSLVLFFGNSDYLQELINGRSIFMFIVTFVGFNAVFEMLVSTAVSGLLGKALEKARILGR
jgi:uncharacterized membrane protein